MAYLWIDWLILWLVNILYFPCFWVLDSVSEFSSVSGQNPIRIKISGRFGMSGGVLAGNSGYNSGVMMAGHDSIYG